MPKNETLKDFVLKWAPQCIMNKGIVCYRKSPNQIRYFAPEHFISTIIYLCHNSVWAGHYSYRKTLWKVQQAWYWPDMEKEIENYCRTCQRCIEVNNPHKISPAPLSQAERVNKFNAHIHLDMLTNLPVSIQSKNRHLVVVTDQYSKYTAFYPIPEKTPQNIAKVLLEHWIPIHSLPLSIGSDFGTENHNKIINHLTNVLGIKHHFSSVGYARSNAEVETQNKIFLQYCRKYLDNNEWENLLPYIHFAYNTQIHNTTRFSPFFLAFNRHPVLPHHVVIKQPELTYSEDEITQKLYLQHKTWQDVLQHSHQAFLTNKRYYDKKAKEQEFRIGQTVYVKAPCPPKVYHKFHRPLTGPFTIVEKKEDNNYVLMGEDRKLLTRNVALLKPTPFEEQQSYLQPRLEQDYRHTKTKVKPDSNIPESPPQSPLIVPHDQKSIVDDCEDDDDDVPQELPNIEDANEPNLDDEPGESPDSISELPSGQQEAELARGARRKRLTPAERRMTPEEQARFSYPRALTRIQSKVKSIPPIPLEVTKKTKKKK